MKILITGGHLTPALSFIDYVQATHPADKLVFVGREFSQDATQQKAVERYEIEKRKVSFLAFEAVRIGPHFLIQPIKQLKHFLTSVKQAKKILLSQKPHLVLSFGGYLAVPFALAAKQLKIPVVTHEQTLAGGFANGLIGLVANKVAVTFPASVLGIFANKTVVTGNPLRPGVFRLKHPRPTWLAKQLDQPLLLVMGGNQGSQTLNELIAQALPELLKNWLVIHQCGQPTNQQNSKAILERQKNRLSSELQKRYYVREWIDESDLFWLYRHAFCALSRSGANATQELAVVGLPAILVPLPSSRNNEQQKNAQWLADAGGAIVVNQAELKTDILLLALAKITTFQQPMRASLATLNLPADAAAQLYALVAKQIKS